MLRRVKRWLLASSPTLPLTLSDPCGQVGQGTPPAGLYVCERLPSISKVTTFRRAS
jgi:hypothetical protein